MRSEYLIIVYLDSVRVTENAFCTFRVFSVRNNLNENIVSIVELVPLSLHNFLHASWFTPPGFTDEIQTDGNISNDTWHYEASSEFLCPVETTKQNQYSKNAEEIPTTFIDYFCGPGEVPGLAFGGV